MKPFASSLLTGLALLSAALLLGGAVQDPAPAQPPGRYGDVDVTLPPYSANGAWPSPATDAAPAIQAALDAYPKGTVYLPPGTYRCNSTLTVRSTQAIAGAPVGANFRQPTVLAFSPGIPGIVVQDDASTGGGQETTISNLVVWGLYPQTTQVQAAGIDCQAGVRIDRVRVTGFHYGIRIAGQTPKTRANLWRVVDCQLDTNKGDGLRIEGGDANGGVAESVSSTANGGWGFRDESGLGNTYIACHARTDVAGAYSIGKGASGVNASVLVGCYAEADCYKSELGDQCLWIGGTNATTVKGGQLLLAGNARLRLQSGGGGVPPVVAMGNRNLAAPALAVQNWAQATTAAFSQDGTLALGLAPGETVPGQGQASPPRLSIWVQGDSPAMKFGVTKAGYVGPVGDIIASADGNGFGAGYVSHRTAGAAAKPVEALRLQNGRVTVGVGGLQLPALSKADRAKLKPAPGLCVFGVEEAAIMVFDGQVWRGMGR